MSILQLEEFKSPTLMGFVENLKAPFEEKTLKFLPRGKESYSTNFAYDIVTRAKSTVAQILEFGGPSPLRDKGSIETKTAEISKIAHKYMFDQKDQLTLLNTKFDKEKQQIVDRALQDVATLTEGVYKAEEYMRASVLYKGRLEYNLNGVILDIGFNIPDENKVVLSGTARWNDYANANPLQDLIRYHALFKKKNVNRSAVEIHMSWDVFWDIINCKTTVAAIKGNAGGTIAPEEINLYLARFGVPPIVIQDETVEFENATEETRLLPVNRVAFLGIQGITLGNTVEGPTVEKKGVPGIYSRTWGDSNTLDEYVEVGKAVFPELTYPSGILHIDVK